MSAGTDAQQKLRKKISELTVRQPQQQQQQQHQNINNIRERSERESEREVEKI